ncbi:MAG TPA: aspartate-semialdehyde dehydrogenase [Oscillospiraceae bacterium]|nr:aspartate-semialdehyde dehydrogenase [Oscillospiraceae bacterium]HPK36458.1 aspartate-semialdehyde dehydrogenase [Oscillospiraceae bacterium]HPR76413.1 aspartate-semialdehyde dehydrogenase [Oscillospiraceae bacterium]
MKTYRVGILGCTGMVGQRFCCLLAKHPYFKIAALAASPRSAGKKYTDAVAGRWAMTGEIPAEVADMTVFDASDIKTVTSMVDFVFCAVDMKKDEIKALEEAYAKAECPVISNNSINRMVDDVPMIIPELNPYHADIIPFQRKRLGTKRGFIAVKSNCSIQSYIPALMPLDPVYGLKDVLVCTYQAISGAGKTFETLPEMVDNVIPYIGGGEEEKSEVEPLKVMGSIIDGKIVPAANINITAQCIRVPVTDGHLAAVYARFEKKPNIEEIKKIWHEFTAEPQKLNLPSAPKQFLHYFEEQDYPQTKLHRDLENGMAVSIGRLREDSQYDIKFVGLSHNTLRGAAGGGVLCAELLCEKGYI